MRLPLPRIDCGLLFSRRKLREVYAGQKLLPTDLRKKQTRAIRRRLTPEQAAKLTSKAQKTATNFPMRKFAVKA